MANANKRLKISKLPFALLLRYLASGFIRFGPRPFRNDKPASLRK